MSHRHRTRNRFTRAKMLGRGGRAKSPHALTYDAARNTGRRKPPAPLLRSEDAELTQSERAAITTGTRDLQRNFSIAAWAIRKHLDYVAAHTFEARTPDLGLNRELNFLVGEWSKKDNCDTARRHSLRRLIRLAEARKTLDGDVLFVKLDSGKLQAIESDRIRTPIATATTAVAVHGVVLNPDGSTAAYAVHERIQPRIVGMESLSWVNSFRFERLVPAESCLFYGAFDRFDQVRGMSPLTAALNSFRDVYEAEDYALAKAKVAQLFALVFNREAATAAGTIAADDTDETGDKYKVDFGKGPIALDLDPGDQAQFLESKHPSTEFQSFCNVVIAASLKALDIPYSFFDESHSNYSGARQALLQYEQSAEEKRRDLREDLLDPLTGWRIALWLADGELVLPEGFDPKDLRWEWIPAGLPWIDPLKEIQADIAAIGAGLDSPQKIARRCGQNAYDILEEIAEWNARRQELGLPAFPPAGTPPAAGPAAGDDEDLPPPRKDGRQ